jgi:hypothetical protein
MYAEFRNSGRAIYRSRFRRHDGLNCLGGASLCRARHMLGNIEPLLLVPFLRKRDDATARWHQESFRCNLPLSGLGQNSTIYSIDQYRRASTTRLSFDSMLPI